MIIFETERLVVKKLERSDKEYFTELFTNSNILKLIPQEALSEEQVSLRFNKSLKFDLRNLHSEKCALGIFEKERSELIGLALFLINEDEQKELGYRFREKYWGKGYGIETTKGMLNFYFNELKEEIVTADVNVVNVASVKILEKFMKPVKEFYNNKADCTDRRYKIEKQTWGELLS